MDASEYDTQPEPIQEYAQHMGNFAYMPKEFLGLSTSELGFCRKGEKSPFLILKEKIIADAEISPEDKMQGVRYLCGIPFANGVSHCMEAVESVIRDERIDIYRRFHFIHSKEKYLRIDDHVAHLAYPLFFKYGLEKGCCEVPFEILVLCAVYIFDTYSPDDQVRQAVLDWCLDIIESPYEDVYTQVEICKFLINHGQQDEFEFADEFIKKLGCESPEDYTSTDLEKMARGILRTLQTVYKVEDNINTFLDVLKKTGATDAQCKTLCDVFDQLYMDCIPSDQVASLVYKAILAQQNEFVRTECLQRICREALGGAKDAQMSHDLIYKLVSVLDGFVEPRPLRFEVTEIEKLRNDVFETIQDMLMSIDDGARNAVYTSIDSEDKSCAREFLNLYDIEDEVWTRCKARFANREAFITLYKGVIGEWLNIKK